MSDQVDPEDALPGSRPVDDDAHEAPRHDEGGLDLARAIARGLAGRTPKLRKRRGDGPADARRAGPSRPSGAHPDERDPQTLDSSLERFVADQGWGTELRVHGVFGRWSAIVGREVAEHCRPESFAEGRLVVRTDSTAWATQLTLLSGTLVKRLNEELGDETVRVIDVVGPRGPSWKRGRLRVKGRGPRDTYG
jgi:predicted nucleic acid-binding Zn ribbon protein